MGKSKAKKIILVLDKGGMAPSVQGGLENELGFRVELTGDSEQARAFLKDNKIDLAIVNPYFDMGGFSNSYAHFIRDELRQKKIPVIVFSRAGAERIAKSTGLVLGEDYSAYLRKPSPPKAVYDAVREVLG